MLVSAPLWGLRTEVYLGASPPCLLPTFRSWETSVCLQHLFDDISRPLLHSSVGPRTLRVWEREVPEEGQKKKKKKKRKMIEEIQRRARAKQNMRFGPYHKTQDGDKSR